MSLRRGDRACHGSAIPETSIFFARRAIHYAAVFESHYDSSI